MGNLLEAGGVAAWSTDVAWGLADAGLKGFVLLAIVGASMTFMRRRSAAARHMVWMLAMAGLLVLPLVSVGTPKLYLALLPAETPALPADAASRLVQAGRPEELRPPILPGTATAIAEGPTGPSSTLNISPSNPEPISEQAWVASADAAAPPKSFPWGLLIVGTWLMGVAFSATPLAFGMWAAHRLVRRGHAIEDASWRRLATELRANLRIRHTVTLLRTDAATMPMAWGFRRPVVLLPEDADGWNEEKRRVVLLHELAHVKRRDCLTHAVARLAFAVHWFNPLAWVVMRRLRIERERACDDLVLNAGSAPADYADHLLHIARSMRNPSLASAAAITMARAGQLEKRLRAILDTKRNRGSVAPWALVVGLILTICAVVVFAVTSFNEEPEGPGASQPDAQGHTIWQGYAATEDAGVLLTGISVRPNEREWYSIGRRGWLLNLWADNNTEETQYLVAEIDARTGGWLSGDTQRVMLFEFPAGFSGAVERPFKVDSSWRENTVSLLVAKSTAVKPGDRLTVLEPGTHEELYKTTLVIPFPEAATLPAKPILKAHRYWRQQDQIWLEFEQADTEWQHPSGEQLPGIYARIIGEVRKTNFSTSPFGSGKSGFALDLGRDEENGSIERRLIPGKYTISLVFRDVPAARKDNPEIRTTFPEITSNEIEIEIVEEIPEGYYEQVYEGGWEEVIREKLQKPTYNAWDEGKTLTVTLNVGENLPCGIAFKASIQAEDDSKTYEMGSIAAPAHAEGGYGNSSECPHDLDVKTLSSKRWRVTYTPSQEVASHNPEIRQFYGREIVTDWMKLIPQQDWIRKALREAGANGISEQLDAVTRDREWPMDLDGTVKTISGSAGPGWEYGKGTDIAQRATQDGGGLRIQPNGETRLLVLEGVDHALDALKFVRHHLDELMASTTTEVDALPDKTVYAAVLTDERVVYVFQIDCDAESREHWLWFEDPVATGQLAGQNRVARPELVVYLGGYGSKSKSGPGAALMDQGSFSVGYEGAMSNVTWETMDTTDAGKGYRFTLRRPVDNDGTAFPNTKTSTKEITYTGGTVALFEEKDIWIGIEETRWNTDEEAPNGQIQPLEVELNVTATPSETDDLTQIRRQVYVLRHFVIPETPDVWVPAVKQLIRAGKAAVPELVAELRRGGDDYAQSAQLIALRGIGDPSVVPALIDLIETTSYGDSDRSLMVGSKETQEFMNEVGKHKETEGFAFMRPISELDGTLKALTGHDEGTEYFMITPDDPGFARVRAEAAERWRTWWRANWQDNVSREALEEALTWDGMEKEDPVEAVGTAAFGVFIPRGPNVHFGPARETSLGPNDGIDFETGAQGVRDGSWDRWLNDKGIDATANTDDGTLRTHACIVWLLDNARWDSIEQELQGEGRLNLGNPCHNAALSPEHFPFPQTFLFRTKQGAVGLLRVDGPDTATQRVSFRYRMLETEANTL